jgi:hypothetical protein
VVRTVGATDRAAGLLMSAIMRRTLIFAPPSGLGRMVLFVPDSQVVHLRGRSVASRARAVEEAYRRSQLAFYSKHHPRWVPPLRAWLKLRGRLPDMEIDPQGPHRQ